MLSLPALKHIIGLTGHMSTQVLTEELEMG